MPVILPPLFFFSYQDSEKTLLFMEIDPEKGKNFLIMCIIQCCMCIECMFQLTILLSNYFYTFISDHRPTEVLTDNRDVFIYRMYTEKEK